MNKNFVRISECIEVFVEVSGNVWIRAYWTMWDMSEYSQIAQGILKVFLSILLFWFIIPQEFIKEYNKNILRSNLKKLYALCLEFPRIS